MHISTSYLRDFSLSPGLSITDTGQEGMPTYDRNTIDNRINAIASGLVRLKLPDNSRIAIIDYVSYNFVTTNVGIYRSGHAIAPINFKLPADLVEFCIKDSGVVMVFCNKQFTHLVPAGMKYIEFDSTEFFDLTADTNFEPVAPGKDFENRDTTVIYTSGTTGKPKAVVNSYRQKFWFIGLGTEKPVQRFESVTTLVALPLYHLGGIFNVEQALFFSSGRTTHMVLMPTFDARTCIEYIQRFRVTWVRLVSAMMSMLLQEKDLLEQADFSHVQTVILNSSFAPLALQNEVKKYFTNLKVLENPYVMTETGALFKMNNPAGLYRPAGSAGYPMQGVDCRINSNGVLEVKGPGVISTYHNLPTNNSITQDGYFVTGDLFWADSDGFYFYLGRFDDMFKCGGEKIYPIEIEKIIDQHPAVALSTVVAVADEIKGHKPFAFVELKNGANATAEEIKQFTIQNVATYQIPRKVWIIDMLPRTVIGKIDRVTLTNMAKQLLETTDDHL